MGPQAPDDGARDDLVGKTNFESGANGELNFAIEIIFCKIREIERFHYVHRDRTAKLCQGMVSEVQKLNPRSHTVKMCGQH